MFHHISLLTRDKETNFKFYTDLLGMRFVKNTVNQDNHQMLHWFYGDYFGAPGTVITFFVVPHLGHRYDNQNFIATMGLKLPANSLDYWENRLKEAGIPTIKKGQQLWFRDPDEVQIILTETQLPPLDIEHQVKNDVPGDKQILGLNSTELHVADPAATSDFFKKLLDWDTTNQKIHFDADEFLAILPTDSTEKTRMGRGGIDHIAFAIESDEALDRLNQKALDQGWHVEKLISRGYFKSLLTKST